MKSGERQVGEPPPTHQHAPDRPPWTCLTPDGIGTTTSACGLPQRAPRARTETSPESSLDLGKWCHGAKCSARVQPSQLLHREEEGRKEVREGEVVKEDGEASVPEEVLEEQLLHHLRRMDRPEDFLDTVKDRLNNRLCVNPPSQQRVAVQAKPGHSSPVVLGKEEREDPTSVQPGDNLLTPSHLRLQHVQGGGLYHTLLGGSWSTGQQSLFGADNIRGSSGGGGCGCNCDCRGYRGAG